MKIKMVKLYSLFCLSMLVMVMAGCNGNIHVGGTVTLDDGTPVKTGRIYFDKEGFSAVGEIVDGKYTVGIEGDTIGLPKGDYVVYFSGIMKTGETIDASGGIDTDTGEAKTMQIATFTPLIEAEYTDPATTPLKYSVTATDDSCDFELPVAE